MRSSSIRGVFATSVAVAMTALSGCIVSSSSSPAGIYETCGGTTCNAGTCASANTTTDGFVGSFCTAACNPSASPPSCPASPNGYQVCVPDNGSPTSGQCYAGCPSGSSGECPYSERCATQGGGVNFCVP